MAFEVSKSYTGWLPFDLADFFGFPSKKKQIPRLVLGGLSHLPETNSEFTPKKINGLEDDRLSFRGFCLLSKGVLGSVSGRVVSRTSHETAAKK